LDGHAFVGLLVEDGADFTLPVLKNVLLFLDCSSVAFLLEAGDLSPIERRLILWVLQICGVGRVLGLVNTQVEQGCCTLAPCG